MKVHPLRIAPLETKEWRDDVQEIIRIGSTSGRKST